MCFSGPQVPDLFVVARLLRCFIFSRLAVPYSSPVAVLQQIEGTEKEWPAQLVVLAMGFVSPESAISKPLKLELDQVRDVNVGRVAIFLVWHAPHTTSLNTQIQHMAIEKVALAVMLWNLPR